ncbi:Holliday junction branch migration protein RuvA [Cereibacter johrii]|uniref:Holliday junction branch migration protein RuvA n=1 Tax=Cereibacter johrii TaxID=445629 RepID=UPI0008465CC1|nr:Holliday junction branch migration protein RuvA [Cereibacter johrii]ODM41576.1 NAD(P)H-hydrate dehydratase [Cereibacter johrii]
MIGKVAGILDFRGPDHVLIDVRGVGYIVYVSDRTLASMPGLGEGVALYTELVVREDLLQLFGFPTMIEKEWHRLLMTVQGVGAKAGMAILGALGAEGTARAITLGDARLSALCLGPGFGLTDRERDLVAVALDAGRPTVLDADALTLVSRERMLRQRLHPGCVLTPHAGEFRRLFPGTPEDEGSRAAAVREAAAETGAVILLKGAETLVAGPEGLAVHAATGARSAPWLATAGAGDVLAGLIAGLLGRGVREQEAAEAGAWLHVEAARGVGPGLIAEDLPEALPAVFRALGL